MITLVLPTRDRSAFLARQLMYYHRVGFQGSIRIGDASKGEHLARNKRLVKGLEGKVDIVHREFPAGNVHHCVQALTDLVKTPYVAYVSDDDFLVPSGLEACRLFLEEHPEYGVAHGKAVKIKTAGSKPYGEVTLVKRARQPVEEADSASERYMHLMANMADVHFSLHRVDRFRAMYEGVDRFADRHFSDALLSNCLAVLNSKIGEVDSLSLVRHIQEEPTRTRDQVDSFFWITGETWRTDFQIFRDILAERLALQDGIGLGKATEVVEAGFSIYLTKRLRKQLLNSHPVYSRVLLQMRASDRQDRDTLRGLGRRIPGARSIWNWVDSSLLHRRAGRYRGSLPPIVDSSTPYLAEFMPVYQAATNAPESIE